MAAGTALLKQSDLTRYAKAMQAAGVDEWRVEIELTGKVVIVVGKAPSDRPAGRDIDAMIARIR